MSLHTGGTSNQDCETSSRKRKHVLDQSRMIESASNNEVGNGFGRASELSYADVDIPSATTIHIGTPPQPTEMHSPGSVQSTSYHKPPKRPKKCNECRRDPGRRSCTGYPICYLCEVRHENYRLSVDWMSNLFLDWSRWLVDLEQAFVHHTASSKPSFNASSFNNMILDFSYEDRLEEPAPTPRTVTFWPYLQHEKYHNRTRIRAERAPSVHLGQLNHAILIDVWGPELCNADRSSLSPDEVAFRRNVQLFTGYLSVLQNLSNTSIEVTDTITEQKKRCVVAELIYALVWQLQYLYFQIIQTCEQFQESSSIVHPSVLFYCLEVMCCLLQTMKKTNWNLSTGRDSDVLFKLEDDLNTSTDRIISRIFLIECHLSGKCKSNRQPHHVPAILQFARDFPSTRRFPKHCLIKISQSNGSEGHVKYPQTNSLIRQRFFDALSSNNLSISSTEQIRFTSWIDDTNYVKDISASSRSRSSIYSRSRSASDESSTLTDLPTMRVRSKREQARLRRSKAQGTGAVFVPQDVRNIVSYGQ